MFDNIQPITLTARAAEEVQNIMRTKNIPEGYALRLGIKGGGCGGVSEGADAKGFMFVEAA
jgi:iron-sulfur cluster assembly protein